MRRYITINVLTDSSLGVLWSPWLSTLQDLTSKVQERSGEVRWIGSVLVARTPRRLMTADVYQFNCALDSDTATLVSMISGTRRFE